MKWILLLALLTLIPIVSTTIGSDRRVAKMAAFAYGFLPFVIAQWHLYMAAISWGTWPGHTVGLEFSILDAISIGVLIGTRKVKGGPDISRQLWFYAFAVAVSVVLAGARVPAVFYLWQVIRMILAYQAVRRLIPFPGSAVTLVSGATIGTIIQALYSIRDYSEGLIQASGNLGSQNMLGLTTHLAVLPALGLLLAGSKGILPKIGPIAGALVAVLTASRATIGLFFIGAGGLVALSAMKNMTPRKGAILGWAVALGVIAAPFALQSLARRQTYNSTEASNNERNAFETATWAMVRDHPLGVGANQYVITANTAGYYSRAGVSWTTAGKSATVHNSYLLVLAETGYLGLLAMVTVLGSALVIGLKAAWRFRKDRRSDLLLGATVALLITCMHLRYEWLFVFWLLQYMLAANFGLIMGVARELGYGVRRPRKRVEAGEAELEPVPAGAAASPAE
jgi:O-antigen ligase